MEGQVDDLMTQAGQKEGEMAGFGLEDLGGEGGQTSGCGDSMEGQVDDLITLAGQREGETAGFGLEHPGQ